MKKDNNYDDIIRDYDKDRRLEVFDKYRVNNIGKKIDLQLDSPMKAKCYIIDQENSSIKNGAKAKAINVNIEAVTRVLGDGELLFRCTCNPNDFEVTESNEVSRNASRKSVFHRLERMMVSVR